MSVEFTGDTLARSGRLESQSQKRLHRVRRYMDVKRMPDAKLVPAGVTSETCKERA